MELKLNIGWAFLSYLGIHQRSNPWCKADFREIDLFRDISSWNIKNHMFRRSYLAHRRDIHDPKYQERKFKCDNCDADFKTRPALTKHIKIVHIGMGRNHRCEECDKAYKTKSQLLVHMHFKHTKHMFVKKCPGMQYFFI